MSEQEFHVLMAAASDRVDALDEVDGGEQQLPLPIQLETIAAALSCGITTQDFGIVAEGLVMLNRITEPMWIEYKHRN